MQRIVSLPFLLLLLLPAGAQPQAAVTTEPRSGMAAQAFLDSIGVNTHVTYKNPSYSNLPVVIRCLRFLGITRVRDQAPLPQTLSRYERMARLGLSFDFVLSGNGGDLAAMLPVELHAIRTLAQRFPGSVAAIEGPNEVNTQPDIYEQLPLSNPVVARRAMRRISEKVKADPVLGGIPLLSLTISNGDSGWRVFQERLGNLAAFVDRANWHVYADRGNQPSAFVSAMYSDAERTAPDRPVVFTEFGYFTGYRAPSGDGVGEATQAKNTMNGLLDAFKLGVKQTYLYELIEGAPNPPPTSFEETFGLFHADGSPKPAAVAIHNLVSILGRQDGVAGRFNRRDPEYTVTGLPETGNTMLLRKPDGTAVLVIWNEAPDWSAARQQEIVAPQVDVTVHFGAQNVDLAVYDPMIASTPVVRLDGVRTADVTVTDHPVIVEIRTPNGFDDANG